MTGSAGECWGGGLWDLLVRPPSLLSIPDPPFLLIPPPPDQQNFTVTLENALTRCLENQKTWGRLLEEKGGQETPWLSPPRQVGGLLEPAPLRGGGAALLLVPPAERPLNSPSLVFPCLSHALQWIAQGRDPHLPAPPPKGGAHPQPVASSGAVLLQEAATIHVLVTGSLHLVGGVLKLLDPSLSQ